MAQRWKVLARHLGRPLHGQPRPLHRQHRLPRPLAPTSTAPRCRASPGSSTPTRSSSPRCSSRPGRIADRVGRKRVFITGLLLFAAASALCAAAPVDPASWSRARVLQAVGAAMMIPTTLGLHPPRLPARAARRWRSASGRRSAASPPPLGPPIGGLLVQLSWHWIFLVNVPIGLVTASSPRARPRRGRANPRTAAPTCSAPPCWRSAIGAAHPRHRQGPGMGLGRRPRARLPSSARSPSVAAFLLPLRPPPRAGDRAAAAAGPLLRPRQPGDAGLLRRLRRDAARRRPAADRRLGLLGADAPASPSPPAR